MNEEYSTSEYRPTLCGWCDNEAKYATKYLRSGAVGEPMTVEAWEYACASHLVDLGVYGHPVPVSAV